MSIYNGAAYLNAAIDSILQQTLQNFEFIIINDGSVDESLTIIQSYADKRIVLINNEGNKGLIYSLNKGFDLANGKYIARMDADDISLANRLQLQFDFLELNPKIGICGCDYIQFSNKTSTLKFAFKKHDEILAWLFFNSSIVHPSLMIRTQELKKLNVFFNPNYKYAEDYELWSRLIQHCQFSAIPNTAFKYRLHSKQVTVQHKTEQKQSANAIRKNILDKFQFDYTQNEFRLHCLIGNSEIISTYQDLIGLEKWLQRFWIQNQKNAYIEQSAFENMIGQQWYDACGITSLGLKAYLYYFKSDLRFLYKGNKYKLLLKCIWRQFIN